MRTRFLVLTILAFLSPRMVSAFQTTVWLSSNTAAVTAATNTLCGQQNYAITGTSVALRGVLHGVCVNTAAAGNIQVFASSFTGINPITGIYSTATQVPCNFYDSESVSGLSYSKVGTGDVTILYQCY